MLNSTRLAALAGVFASSMQLRATASPPCFDGGVVFFRAARGRKPGTPEPQSWRPYVTGAITVHDVEATHGTLTAPAPIDHIGTVIARYLSTATEES